MENKLPNEIALCQSEYAEKLAGFKAFVQTHYEFRFNVLSQQVEYRDLYSKHDFRMLDKYSQNSILLSAKKAGSELSNADMKMYLVSDNVQEFNPISSYISNLPEWNGKDVVTPLILRLTDNPALMKGLHCWLRGMTAQMMGLNMTCANSLMPILVSSVQGKRKSTFCRLLVPEQLSECYTERMDVSEGAHFQELMASSLIINIDEFDRLLTPAKQASLKNILQLKTIKYRKLHTNFFMNPQRVASFIGTSNEKQVLIDPTGSRRFIVIEVKDEIDCSPVDHGQLFAQLRQEILSGELTYLTRDEEAEIEELNKEYEAASPEGDLLALCFRQPEPGEKCGGLSSTEIANTLKRRYPKVAQGIKPNALAAKMNAMGIECVHRNYGNRFMLMPIEG